MQADFFTIPLDLHSSGVPAVGEFLLSVTMCSFFSIIQGCRSLVKPSEQTLGGGGVARSKPGNCLLSQVLLKILIE